MSALRKTGGFAVGTRILCGGGPTPVECVRTGDRVLTRDAGIARVTDITRRTVRARFVTFQPYSMDETGPMSEILLPPDQMVLIRNWRAREVFGTERALVEARSLVDDMFIKMTEPREEVLFQISFSSPHILYLEGVEVGSADAVKGRGSFLHPAE